MQMVKAGRSCNGLVAANFAGDGELSRMVVKRVWPDAKYLEFIALAGDVLVLRKPWREYTSSLFGLILHLISTIRIE